MRKTARHRNSPSEKLLDKQPSEVTNCEARGWSRERNSYEKKQTKARNYQTKEQPNARNYQAREQSKARNC